MLINSFLSGKAIIDKDFSVLLKQWRNLYQQQFFYLTGSHDNIAQPCTTERKFPQEFKKLHRGLAGLLTEQGRRPGSDKSESNNLFYALLHELYEKLMGVLQQAGNVVPMDNGGQLEMNDEFYREMQNLYKKMGQALRQTSTVAGHDDALLRLTEEYKKITTSWPTMPKAYEGWFEELRKVYQKTQNGSGSPVHASPKDIYALKSTDPWFTRTRDDLNHRVIRIQKSQKELLFLAKWGEEALRNLSQHCEMLDTRLTETWLTVINR